MLELKIEDGRCACKMSGNLMDITAEACVAIHAVWDGISEDNPAAAKEFATLIRRAVNDNMLFCDEDKLRIKVAEAADTVQKHLDDLLESLGLDDKDDKDDEPEIEVPKPDLKKKVQVVKVKGKGSKKLNDLLDSLSKTIDALGEDDD